MLAKVGAAFRPLWMDWEFVSVLDLRTPIDQSLMIQEKHTG